MLHPLWSIRGFLGLAYLLTPNFISSTPQLAQRKAEESAREKGHQVRPETLRLAAFVLVLTSLPVSWGTALVLELYRARWQVELAFKRLKQLLAAGHVPKTTDPSSRAWLQAKILTALLIEHMIHAGRFFSPWGYRLPSGAPVAGLQRSAG